MTMAAGYRGYDVSYKILLVGDSGVGKTALLRNLTGRSFMPNYQATVGIDFVKKIYEIDGARVQLEIWDTAGQERFRTITRFQYRGTKGLLLVYDVTCRDSFAMLNYWLGSIDKELDGNNKEPIPVFVLGNKADLVDLRQITREQGKQAADGAFVHGFMESSAKLGINVDKAFRKLATAVTEINNPKLMNAYLTPDERKDRELRRMGQINIFTQSIGKNPKIKLTEPVKTKLKCACS